MNVRCRTLLVATTALTLAAAVCVSAQGVTKRAAKGRLSRRAAKVVIADQKIEMIAQRMAQTSLRLPPNLQPENAQLVATLTPHEMSAVQTFSDEIYRAEAVLNQALWGPGSQTYLDEGTVLVTSRRAGDILMWVRLAEADSWAGAAYYCLELVFRTPEAAQGSLELAYVRSDWASAPPPTLDPETGEILAETRYGGYEGDLSLFSDVFVVEQAPGSDAASHNFFLVTGDDGPHGLLFREANLYRISE